MKRKILVLLMVVILLLIGCSSEKNAKKTIKENNDPENNRIVSTTVAVTEIMDALEIDLIGIPTSYKKLPKRYKGITEVGNPMSPDMELIMSLQPKEVMSVTTLKYDLESVFEDAGINTRYVNLESIDDMYSEVLKIGEQYKRQEQAEKIVNEFDEKLKETEKKIEGKPAPKVLILMGVPGSYLVATDRSYIGDLVEKSGGINVFSGEKVEYLASNTEYLQQSNPDIILRAAHGMPDEVVEMFDKEFKENDIWKHFDAVKNNRVYDLEETLFGTTGNLAASEALDVMVELLYSE
ncbi:heme ABC transporter substrate-binding protein IsdE [Bacillus norwichensis]|uniref:High-affinity heme uptake system protein IsdE n=1 Tax=Bacillus norwichensis TaxID=2762217 RepID=A0ABR8VHC0_9BACI|nr:heme ABC transporter substrate-binding protein IsdE [Bacillus norwichensis]MBD8004167.1 heme ABC transporter substrate-binding protein IsdE [Bacillus norwichensis]